ncbi:MarR family winged helix-turn-helix transcriptional regulator [Amycolatopsis oliviviridis]|uniref:MarR family transcriptional regulator n=1 Tax=Amycolatopsis oliviviridis TaxID=1471590 RepID=A0ABQ3M4L5_9PSEU|nr:MarR family winged helix-turn-helix transcriptional regulator [Amycolatopsis oliviviridis]GHH32588.1 MarR family transcriptional regulator [Amycolatopsis oliviviridis]
MSDPGPGQALFAFVRHWARRSTAGDLADQGRLVLVGEAVHSLAGREVPATVNAIAREVGIDQSGVSRLIKAAVEAGYLSMESSRTDARRREVSLTPAGLVMLDQAHRWQEEVFYQLTVGWSERRRRDFRQAMGDLIDRSHLVNTP